MNTNSSFVKLIWTLDLNFEGMELFCFESSKVLAHMYATMTNLMIGKVQQVTQSLLSSTTSFVKDTCIMGFFHMVL